MTKVGETRNQYDKPNAESLDRVAGRLEATHSQLEKIGKSQEEHGKKMFWVTLVVAIATSVGAIAAILTTYWTIFKTHP